jgi:exosortase
MNCRVKPAKSDFKPSSSLALINDERDTFPKCLVASFSSLETQVFMTKLAKHQTGLTALWVITLLAGWRPLLDTFALSLRDDEFTYILLIVPVSAALIFMDWQSLRTKVAFGITTGPVFLITAVLIASLVLVWPASLPSDVRLSIRMVALVISWIGIFALCFGSRALRQALFPLCFLFGLVPLPKLMLNEIIAWLQLSSAWAASVLFAICGVPVTQDGVLLTIPTLTVQVAQECSSIRSSSMLLVTTIVLAQLLLRSPWRKALVIGSAVPLSIAKNGLRIFSIGMLGTHVDRGYLTGRFHHQGGIVFFAIALLVVFALLWILRSGEVMPTISEWKKPEDVLAAG